MSISTPCSPVCADQSQTEKCRFILSFHHSTSVSVLLILTSNRVEVERAKLQGHKTKQKLAGKRMLSFKAQEMAGELRPLFAEATWPCLCRNAQKCCV